MQRKGVPAGISTTTNIIITDITRMNAELEALVAIFWEVHEFLSSVWGW